MMVGVCAAALGVEPILIDGVGSSEVCDPAQVPLLCVFGCEPDVVHDQVEVLVPALGDNGAPVVVGDPRLQGNGGGSVEPAGYVTLVFLRVRGAGEPVGVAARGVRIFGGDLVHVGVDLEFADLPGRVPVEHAGYGEGWHDAQLLQVFLQHGDVAVGAGVWQRVGGDPPESFVDRRVLGVVVSPLELVPAVAGERVLLFLGERGS